ncbi:asparagine synthetase [Gryganskiella cystojenkinii]|nr:asparagine synthetase [Gryganskiella cystojenkinii]
MCGIFAIFNLPGDANAYRQRALYLSKKLRHRGPDWSGCVVSGNHILCHERLAIVGQDRYDIDDCDSDPSGFKWLRPKDYLDRTF